MASIYFTRYFEKCQALDLLALVAPLLQSACNARATCVTGALQTAQQNRKVLLCLDARRCAHKHSNWRGDLAQWTIRYCMQSLTGPGSPRALCGVLKAILLNIFHFLTCAYVAEVQPISAN